MKTKNIRKVAILGAGVMGAQIAAHFANAGTPAILFDLAAKDGDKNGIVNNALKTLKKLKPAPLGNGSVLSLIEPANYEDDLAKLKQADLIIEAVAERMDIKKSVYDMVEDYINEDAIFATNTSGLSINELATVLPASLQSKFCGVHFFNPPRYMHLVEIIPIESTSEQVVNDLEAVLTTVVGKGVIIAKDTPNFIANRIGVFSIVSTMYHGAQFGIPFETIDALTGVLIGRPKSATFRTADVVGLDTLAHTINTMKNGLPDDPWHAYFDQPDWMSTLIEKGALGQKSGAGVYMKKGRDILVLDTEKGEYRAQDAAIDPAVLDIMKKGKPQDRLKDLHALKDSPQAQFLWSIFRDLFHYCATQLEHIADTARDIDFAIRWGFGYGQGPFETWQASGWNHIVSLIVDDIDAGKTMASSPLPAWVMKVEGAHAAEGSYSAAEATFKPRSSAAVYERQLFPELLISEQADYGETIFEDDDIRIWHQGDEIAIASFKTKKHIIAEGVLKGLRKAVKIAETDYKGLIVWQTEEPFSLGANLAPAAMAIADGQVDQVEQSVDFFQQTSQALRFSAVPTVIATRGMALGGGCEFSMSATAVVAAFETYIGLVEAGVGLLPAGGGLKEIARRTAAETFGNDLYPMLEHYFKKVAMAAVAGSAAEAKEIGFLKANTEVVMNAKEILYVAKAKVNYLHDRGYVPPANEQAIKVAGEPAIANMEMILANMLEGHMISAHDYEIAKRIAIVIAGGYVDAGSLVTEQYLLDLERKYFMELIQMPKTLARIEHTLKTGKPLRN
ncbi:3-hydroxyacyl-CoA dehydrogenase NAD-binding domain-containing protein [Marinicella sp. S1101]|uniref:3-hydroxyacyl-CoA dehydrogenase/enoyl-CoA hydratase family protein n=1 Tax=Marinicella marina TaxID=2996016 RepID=UPI002260C697|nr:3-hydroxyacyl-CoA dehydrogenase NAD-binding domain-containing protein [Marinicella marina]MCX7553787.1 3-hydroxyacyl-CoA dehydrogenase NAD-binding domain-containing protein [Marinicella marina]MDJ1140862.1 3-hydroxyacyl-CoA dehydrogenase NAD-binding domain-containing protein [Marinicella marina]